MAQCLPEDVILDICSFLDADSVISMSSVSKSFFRALDHDPLWKHVGQVLYPHVSHKNHPYLRDWRALVCDRNKKAAPFLERKNKIHWMASERYRTSWEVIPNTSIRVRLIIDPHGNPNLLPPTVPLEPGLSVYVEIHPDHHNTTLSFRFSILSTGDRETRFLWKSSHHFTNEDSNWGVHRLIQRDQITTESGILRNDCFILQTRISIVTLHLRIIETSEMKQHRGIGLMHLDTRGHTMEVMGGETIRSLRQKKFPLQPSLVFWVCEYRERCGLLPILRITGDDEETRLTDLSRKYKNKMGEMILWADRFDDRTDAFFLKTLDDKEDFPRFQKRASLEELTTAQSTYGLLVLEKTLEEVSLSDLSTWNISEIAAAQARHGLLIIDKTIDPTWNVSEIILAISPTQLEKVRTLYQSYRNDGFSRLEQMLQDYDDTNGYRTLSMRKILLAGSRMYNDWRIMYRLLTHHRNKASLLREMIQRPHLSYMCDRCGTSNFTGTRYKCRQCRDYDLCKDCYDLPILSSRYVFDRREQDKKIRVKCNEHKPFHSFCPILY
jgi:hypothetical protein